VSVVAIGTTTAVLCSIGWAVLDVLRKQLVARIDPLPLVVGLTVGQLPVLLVWAVVAGDFSIAPAYWPWALASIALNIGANVLYLDAVGRGHFSVAIPLLAFVPVFATLLGVPLLAQLPTPLQWVGIAGVVLGAILLHGGFAGLRAIGLSLVRDRSTRAMLLVSLGWAGTIVLDRRAIEHASLPLHALLLDVGIAIGVLAWLASRRQLAVLGQMRRAPVRLFVAATVAGVSLGLQLRAMQDVLIAVLEALKRSVGVGAAIVLGRIVFAEPITPVKLLACGLMAAGTVLVVGLG
jgi:drug/metabolite transporter (DMT)-like permease